MSVVALPLCFPFWLTNEMQLEWGLLVTMPLSLGCFAVFGCVLSLFNGMMVCLSLCQYMDLVIISTKEVFEDAFEDIFLHLIWTVVEYLPYRT